MLAAAYIRCTLGQQSKVDSGRRRDDSPPERTTPLGCAHTSIMALASDPFYRGRLGGVPLPGAHLPAIVPARSTSSRGGRRIARLQRRHGCGTGRRPGTGSGPTCSAGPRPAGSGRSGRYAASPPLGSGPRPGMATRCHFAVISRAVLSGSCASRHPYWSVRDATAQR